MPTPLDIRTRLREIRRQQGLTLKQVEIKSRGRWKAVVVGSYERGSRTLSFDRAASLCDFYGVPLSSLIKEKNVATSLEAIPVILDLGVIRLLAQSKDHFLQALIRFLNGITERRQDWNGHLLSVRDSDLETIGLMTSLDREGVKTGLLNRNLLFKERVRP